MSLQVFDRRLFDGEEVDITEENVTTEEDAPMNCLDFHDLREPPKEDEPPVFDFTLLAEGKEGKEAQYVFPKEENNTLHDEHFKGSQLTPPQHAPGTTPPPPSPMVPIPTPEESSAPTEFLMSLLENMTPAPSFEFMKGQGSPGSTAVVPLPKILPTPAPEVVNIEKTSEPILVEEEGDEEEDLSANDEEEHDELFPLLGTYELRKDCQLELDKVDRFEQMGDPLVSYYREKIIQLFAAKQMAQIQADQMERKIENFIARAKFEESFYKQLEARMSVELEKIFDSLLITKRMELAMAELEFLPEQQWKVHCTTQRKSRCSWMCTLMSTFVAVASVVGYQFWGP